MLVGWVSCLNLVIYFCSYCCLFCGLVGLLLVCVVGCVWLRLFVLAAVFVWCFCLEFVGCFVLTFCC